MVILLIGTRYDCPDCDKSYTLATNLQRHRKLQCCQQPGLKRPYVCPDCNKSYSLPTNLQRHRKFQCRQQPKFKCPFCPQRTWLKFNILPHVRNKHPDKLDVYFTLVKGTALQLSDSENTKISFDNSSVPLQ